MSEISDPMKWSSRERIRRLASSIAGGRAYERFKDVDEEISKAARLHQAELIANVKGYQSETIVFFIKQTHRVEPEVCGVLLQELSRRTLRMVRRWIWGLDKPAAED